jgi:hypothetical protein
MFHFQLEVNDKMSRPRAGQLGQHPCLVENNWQYPRIEERYIQMSSDDLHPFESGGILIDCWDVARGDFDFEQGVWPGDLRGPPI